MNKKITLKQKIKKDKIQDCVIFMTAYNVNKYNKKLPHLRKKNELRDLLIEHHILSFATHNMLFTRNGRLKYTVDFNSYKESTKFKFDVCDEKDKLEEYEDEINQTSWFLPLSHSIEQLLDRSMFHFSFFINMESFLVSINSRLLQVDPIAFFLNGMVFINFELIDYNTAMPFSKDEIYGRNNNYNILQVDGIQYFGEEEIVADKRKISDIIFENIIGFFEKLTRYKFQVGSFSYVHNLFVVSNSITDLKTYFLNVLGADGLSLDIKNINTNTAYEYYSQEYLGVVTAVSDGNERQSLFDCQLLEVLKMYFCLNLIVNFEITNKLDDTINNQMYIERLSFLPRTPIITSRAIDNMKQTESFKRFKDAINFKISYLNLLQERRKNRNALLLNILLYILAFIGGISTLQVLQSELGWSFKICAIALTVIFLGGGTLWVWLERKK